MKFFFRTLDNAQQSLHRVMFTAPRSSKVYASTSTASPPTPKLRHSQLHSAVDTPRLPVLGRLSSALVVRVRRSQDPPRPIRGRQLRHERHGHAQDERTEQEREWKEAWMQGQNQQRNRHVMRYRLTQ